MNLQKAFLISHLQRFMTSEGCCLCRQRVARQLTSFWNRTHVWFSSCPAARQRVKRRPIAESIRSTALHLPFWSIAKSVRVRICRRNHIKYQTFYHVKDGSWPPQDSAHTFLQHIPHRGRWITSEAHSASVQGRVWLSLWLTAEGNEGRLMESGCHLRKKTPLWRTVCLDHLP